MYLGREGREGGGEKLGEQEENEENENERDENERGGKVWNENKKKQVWKKGRKMFTGEDNEDN